MNEQKPQTNAADEGQLKEAKESAKDRQRRYTNALLKAMHDDEIGWLLTELLRAFHTDESPVASSDQFETHRRIGIQSAGRLLKKQMKQVDRKRFHDLELKFGEEK